MKQINIPFKLYGDTPSGKLLMSHSCDMCATKILDISQKNIVLSRDVRPMVRYYFCDNCLKKDYLQHIEDSNYELVTGNNRKEEKERMAMVLNLFKK